MAAGQVAGGIGTIDLGTSLSVAVGQKAAGPLGKKLGLHTVGDLVRHYPRRYVENASVSRSTEHDARSLPREGEYVTILAEIESASGRRMRNRKGHIFEVLIHSEGRQYVCTFFNQPWRERTVQAGMRALFAGEVSRYRGRWQLAAPDLELVDGDAGGFEMPGLIPIYPAANKLPSWNIMRAVRQVLDVLDVPTDPLPDDLRRRHSLAALADSLRGVHFADTWAEQEAARRRLVWDEAFGLQLALQGRRAVSASGRPAAACPRREDGIAAAFDTRLPFALTESQQVVGASLAGALAETRPLNRLLQGDVGSGKTIVALRAMLQVVDAGRQAVLLAPTEVLAAQHARSLRAMLGPLGRAGELDAAEQSTAITLLTGSLGAKARRQALLDAQSGAAGIVVGTHAVIQQSVGFADLGLVVVDEQHRFGVHQRDELRSRPGETTPHVLVMTATPIPRTVALTLYGDLDTSVLTDLPAGRTPISTTAVPGGKPRWLERAWQRVHEEVTAGHQVYVVCPRIGDGGSEPDEPHPDEPGADDGAEDGADDRGADGSDGRRPPLAVTEVGPMLAEGPLAGLRTEILHGRLPADEKDAIMRAFADGAIDVLVSTTVIEVGVDVPNATLMIIMDADRFGVSQLHQLRGRVGRGGAASTCLLVTDSEGPALDRLNAVAATTDGFRIAELDLQLRDEGDVLGSDQSGRRSGLHMLSVQRHTDLITEARDAAREVIDADPMLADHPELAGLVRSVVPDEGAAFLERL